MFNFKRNYQTVFQNGYKKSYSHQQCMRISVAILNIFLIVSILRQQYDMIVLTHSSLRFNFLFSWVFILFLFYQKTISKGSSFVGTGRHEKKIIMLQSRRKILKCIRVKIKALQKSKQMTFELTIGRRWQFLVRLNHITGNSVSLVREVSILAQK